MKLFNRKNYDEDIENLQNRLETVENENKELKSQISHILGILTKKENGKYRSPPNSTVPRGKDKKSRKRAKKDSHITELSNFESNRKPRHYDEEEDCFYSIKSDGSKFKLELSFAELVELIKEYKRDGAGGGKIYKRNIILSKYSAGNLTNRLYIYRAGGFNDAIKKYAPKKGYNADKLISREVEE